MKCSTHPLAAVLLLAAVALAQAPAPADDLGKAVDENYASLHELYTWLHRNPELSFQEQETAKRLSAELEACGFTVTRGFGGHGLVAVLENGEGPTLMLRADMDALPIEEATGLGYASKKKVKDGDKTVGVMHACGHDVHMTVFVGAARVLARFKDRWAGTLVMVGQPAEERGAGARAMLADGLFEQFPRPDHALALHVAPQLPAGMVGAVEGPALASVDMVDLVVHGRGGHGAFPHDATDPIVMAAEIVLSLQAIVSREIDPAKPAVVTVGSIHGGTKHNIIPGEVKLEITCRSYDDDVRKAILASIDRRAKSIARAHGMSEDRLPVMTVREESIPATINDGPLTRRFMAVARNVLGDDKAITTPSVMGGEDFGLYGRAEPPVPICIYWLGVSNPVMLMQLKKKGLPPPSLHSATFAPVPEPSIKTGVKTMSAAALDLLKRP